MSSFLYLDYQWQIKADQLFAEWHFKIQPDIKFKPTLTIPLPTNFSTQASLENKKELIDQLIFHIGLVEMFSYWKATASPQIIIKAGYLSGHQIAWWRNLLIKGMGEYFYRNQIDFTQPDFAQISCHSPHPSERKQTVINNLKKGVNQSNQELAKDQYQRLLIPLGGGKDSTLTLELLSQNKHLQILSAAINPTPAIRSIAQIANVKLIAIQRQLDSKLLELNSQGYLNGHTPFNALTAFILSLTAYLYDLEAVVISNERSSNEGNTQYLSHTINHQYSKSFEFETDFRQYIAQFFNPTNQQNQPFPTYFSLLRPLYELQIAQRFAQYGSPYFTTFRSCNVGQKTNTWCGECSKCLFAFTILFPFLGEKQMIQIFGSNLFDSKMLLATALELIGQSKTKPFECVGTYRESLAAFYLSTQWYRHHAKPLPIILKELDRKIFLDPKLALKIDAQQLPLSRLADSILQAWSDQHHVPSELLKLLKIQ